MKFLGFVIVGIFLGYLIGSQIGTARAAEEGGFLSFLVVDAYKEHYSGQGAIVGGIIGGFISLFICD